MTPDSLDVGVVHAKLATMRDLLDDLEGAGALDASRLESDRLLRHAVERILTQLVELAASVNGHVAVAVLGKGPSDYRSSFGLAAEAGFIPQSLADDLAPSAGLRNVLVHEYASIDLARVAESLGDAGAAYRRYVAEVAHALRARQGDEPQA